MTRAGGYNGLLLLSPLVSMGIVVLYLAMGAAANAEAPEITKLRQAYAVVDEARLDKSKTTESLLALAKEASRAGYVCFTTTASRIQVIQAIRECKDPTSKDITLYLRAISRFDPPKLDPDIRASLAEFALAMAQGKLSTSTGEPVRSPIDGHAMRVDVQLGTALAYADPKSTATAEACRLVASDLSRHREVRLQAIDKLAEGNQVTGLRDAKIRIEEAKQAVTKSGKKRASWDQSDDAYIDAEIDHKIKQAKP